MIVFGARSFSEAGCKVKPNAFHFCLDNYEVGHPAHLNGLLDEVRLYARALTPDEVRQHYRAMAGRLTNR